MPRGSQSGHVCCLYPTGGLCGCGRTNSLKASQGSVFETHILPQCSIVDYKQWGGECKQKLQYRTVALKSLHTPLQMTGFCDRKIILFLWYRSHVSGTWWTTNIAWIQIKELISYVCSFDFFNTTTMLNPRSNDRNRKNIVQNTYLQ